MTDVDLQIVKDKVKYLIEIEQGKQYLFVFDRRSGLSEKELERIIAIIKKSFRCKAAGLLLNDIDSMRVLTLEEK